MKIGALPIVLIGLALALGVLSFAFFYHWEPKTQEIVNKDAELVELKRENAKARLVAERVEDAKMKVREKAARWKRILAAKTPPTSVERGGIDVSVNAYQLTVDSRRFRDSIQRAVNAQVKKGGVRVVAGPVVPEPTDDPTTILTGYYNVGSALPYPVIIFDLGTVTVEGTYSQIMANVRSWSNMPNYLAVADGLAITGTSPRLTGTYNVSIVGFIRATSYGPPAVVGAGATPANNPSGGGVR
jgi:hypothetical protein